MIRTVCVSNSGYKELTIGAYYYFDNFKAINPYTKDIFGNLYAFLDGKYQYIGLFPKKLFAIAN